MELFVLKVKEGGYIGVVPIIPEALTQGKGEVKENIKDVIQVLEETRVKIVIKELEK